MKFRIVGFTFPSGKLDRLVLCRYRHGLGVQKPACAHPKSAPIALQILLVGKGQVRVPSSSACCVPQAHRSIARMNRKTDCLFMAGSPFSPHVCRDLKRYFLKGHFSNCAMKKPFVSSICGKRVRVVSRRIPDFSMLSATASFSARLRVQVQYTSRPPGLT